MSCLCIVNVNVNSSSDCRCYRVVNVYPSPAWQVQFTRSEEIGIVIELLRSIELYEPLLECDGR